MSNFVDLTASRTHIAKRLGDHLTDSAYQCSEGLFARYVTPHGHRG